MTTKRERYAAMLSTLPEKAWLAYLAEHSNLPGPRGNLELLHAFAPIASADLIDAARGSDDEFVRCCGVAALGCLLAHQEPDDGSAPSSTRSEAGPMQSARLAELHEHARDESWRVREGVAMALQYLGDSDRAALRVVAETWARDPDPLVRRAAVAGICEPRLLDIPTAASALDACETAGADFAHLTPIERRDGSRRVLRQALGYCWSVAVAADPARGLPRFEAFEQSGASDPDLAWIARENRKKARLARLLSR